MHNSKLTQELPEKIIGKIREKTCKECHRKFRDEHYTTICRKCIGKMKHKSVKQYSKQCTTHKQKWITKIGLTKIPISAEPKWDDDYFQARSTEKCVDCNEYHFKGDQYYHTFKKEITVLGLPINHVKELLEEYQHEKRKTTINTFMKKRGLEIKQINKEVLRI